MADPYPMNDSPQQDLSRRERQIMDVLYRDGKATAAEVLDGIPEAPSYSAVRALLRILEDKGHVAHEKVGPRYVYHPVVPANRLRSSALRHVVTTFFDGSVSNAVAALLDETADDLSSDELERIRTLIELAKQEGR